MGTITRGFANNITTSGVFTSSAFNNDSFDNVTSVPSGSVESGSMVLVSSATASSSASIEFTLGDYKEYKFFFVNIHPSSNTLDFEFNLSTDNGSNYNVTKTTSYFRAYHTEGGASGFGYETNNDLAQSTSYQKIMVGLEAQNDNGGGGFMTLFNPSSTTFVKHFIATSSFIQTSNTGQNSFMAGYGNTTSALTNIKFQMSSGNIDDGKILMFGIN
jgi:hypothetical protein